MPDFREEGVGYNLPTSHALLGISELVSGATVSASPALSEDFSAQNLKTNDFSRPYRAADRSSSIAVRFKEPTPLNVVAVVGHNMSSEALMDVTYFEASQIDSQFEKSMDWEVKVGGVVTARPAWFGEGLDVDEAAVVKSKKGYKIAPGETLYFVIDSQVTEGSFVVGGENIYDEIATEQQQQNTLVGDHAPITVSGRRVFAVFCPPDETYQGRYYPEVEFFDDGSGVEIKIESFLVSRQVRLPLKKAVVDAYRWGDRPFKTFRGDGKMRKSQAGLGGRVAYYTFPEVIVVSEFAMLISDSQADGFPSYLEISRMCAYEAFWALFNVSKYSEKVIDDSRLFRSDKSVTLREPGPKYREVSIQFSDLFPGEEMRLYDLVAFDEADGGVLLIPEPEDYYRSQRRAVFGFLNKGIEFKDSGNGRFETDRILIEEVR